MSFCHDMDAHNRFSPAGHSSYELPHLTGCFSYMPMEQLLNWTLLAGCYAASTGDPRWLDANAGLLEGCAERIRSRTDASGILTRDARRCAGGAEITTYDPLDESLGQARGSTYIAVKTWAAWLALDLMHRLRTGNPHADARAYADSIAAYLPTRADHAGTLPAIVEPNSPGFASRILPAAEALAYPAWWLRNLPAGDAADALRDALDTPMIATLRRRCAALLRDPRRPNLFPDGGIKLSSMSDNPWISKLALFLHVARHVLALDDEPDLAHTLRAADAAPVRWQVQGGRYWAYSDQFIRGVARGSRYYPRIVTAALWLDESADRWGTALVASARA